MKSNSRTIRVLVAIAVMIGGYALTEVDASGTPPYLSQDCGSHVALSDGSTVVTFGMDTIQVYCYRVDSPHVQLGGVVGLRLWNLEVPPVPTIDADTQTCGDVVRSGAVGEPGDAEYVPYRVATGNEYNATFLCVDVGDQHQRLVLRFQGPRPEVVNEQDPEGFRTYPAALPSGLPSTTCDGKPGSVDVLRVDHAVDVNGPEVTAQTQTWLTVWPESPTRVHVCAATRGGPVSAGGVLTVDTTNTGVAPPISTGTDALGCTRNVVRDDQSGVAISRSPDGEGLVSVCVTAAETVARVSFDTSSNVTPPVVAWTPDGP